MYHDFLVVQAPLEFQIAVVEMINPDGCVGQNHLRLPSGAECEENQGPSLPVPPICGRFRAQSAP
jgi:hypothetical protein